MIQVHDSEQMEALYELIQALAKEEKRLYNLHGRKSRFTAIYEGYADAKKYDKSLDREIFAAHYSNFSRAFYSMQKTDLLQDILSVLLEYSNPSDPHFRIARLKSKSMVLRQKGFPEVASDFLTEAVEVARSADLHKEKSRLLEDLLEVYPETEDARWEEYEQLLQEWEAGNPNGFRRDPESDMKVLIRSAASEPELLPFLKQKADGILNHYDAEAEAQRNPEGWMRLLELHIRFGSHFETPMELHQRLVKLEKRFNQDGFQPELRLKVIISLLESAMNVGDFLLINALIYKTRNLVRSFPQEIRQEQLPRYLELAGIFHFYENELPTAIEEFREVLGYSSLPAEMRIRVLQHLASSEHAANLSQQAKRTLIRMSEEFPYLAETIPYKLLELMVAVETGDRELSANLCQKFRTYLRKQPNPRTLLGIRNFVDFVKKLLEKKSVKPHPMAGLDPGWEELYRPSLWLKAKTDNSFYYNRILDFWQERKKVMKS